MEHHNDTKETKEKDACMACACPCEEHTKHTHDPKEEGEKCSTCTPEGRNGGTCACEDK